MILRATAQNSYRVIVDDLSIGSIRLTDRANGQDPVWSWSINCLMYAPPGSSFKYIGATPHGIEGSLDDAKAALRRGWEANEFDLDEERKHRLQVDARAIWPEYWRAHGDTPGESIGHTPEQILAWDAAGRPAHPGTSR